MIHQIKKRITVPQYFRNYIDSSVDLNETPKICCPFHSENTPSFSYSRERMVWRCFGACGVGGDVIALHQKHRKIDTREEAIESLRVLLGIPLISETTFQPKAQVIDEEGVEMSTLLNRAERACRKSEHYVELDYIMSYYEKDFDRIRRLRRFIDDIGHS